MRGQGRCTEAAVIFAALAIIGCSIQSIRVSRKRRIEQTQQLEVAQQTWGDEGGAIVPQREEEVA